MQARTGRLCALESRSLLFPTTNLGSHSAVETMLQELS